MSDHSIHKLSNGLRFVHSSSEGKVSYSGVVIGVGSRDEPASRQGLAHFVEHTIFKGTRSRKSWHISNRMESVGGELNAYTSKEETVIFTNSPSGNEERAFDLLADLVMNASFPAHEIDLEREVVIEEINSYLDNPGELVFDYFEDRIYKGSSLGHNILGSPDSVKIITAEDCKEYVSSRYTAQNIVLYSTDNLPDKKALALAERYFGKVKIGTKAIVRTVPPRCSPFNEIINRNSHQAHTIIGTRVFGRDDSRRFALFLLNNYLGGPCMNSRLNQELRDKRGYVYTVDSMVSLLSDSGAFMIYTGSDIGNVEKCTKLIFKEIERLLDKKFSQTFFNKIKRQYAGQLTVASDNRENLAMSLGKNILYFNKVNDINFITQQIEAVTEEQFKEVAEMIQPEKLSKLTLC